MDLGDWLCWPDGQIGCPDSLIDFGANVVG